MTDQLPPELLLSCKTNHGPALLALGWTLLSLAIITIGFRLYFRHYYRNGIHMDDWIMLASLISGIVAVSYLTLLVRAGLGQHIYCLPPTQIAQAIHASILGQIFNILGIGLVKVSVCLTVLRIIDRGVPTPLKLFILTLLVFACLSHAAQVLLFIVQCRPMRAIWDLSLVTEGKAKCFSPHITYLAGYIGFGLDAFTDLACSAIPIAIINRLQMSSRTKLALCVLMGLGSLTAGCAIAKAVTLRGVFADDYTYGLTKPAVCTILEHLCGMILASVPALRPLVRTFLLIVSERRSGDASSERVKRKGRWSGPTHVEGGLDLPARADERKREKENVIESEGTTVVASPTSTALGGAACTECGGTGVGGMGRITKTVSWHMSEHYSDVERAEEEDARKATWPLETGSQVEMIASAASAASTREDDGREKRKDVKV